MSGWRSTVARRVLDGTTLSRKILDEQLESVLTTMQAATVLDIGGAGGGRYRGLVAHHQYWSVDVQPKNRPSLQADAHDLPLRDGVADLVLCLQVLEHCRDPRRVVEEAYRVLKPGGRLVLSTVLIYELHGSPHDYYRFTESALLDLARQFKQARCIAMGNRFVAAYDLLAARSLLLNSLFGRLAFSVGRTAQAACPTGYVLVAQKDAS